jgi:hypothetical protein
MRIPVSARLGAAAAAIAALTASTNAWAQHYYAVTYNNTPPLKGPADNGAYVEIDTSVLHATCNIAQRDIVTHELWYLTDSSGSYWIEVGFFDGAANWPGCSTHADFWADSRPGGGFNEHFPGNSWNFDTWYGAEVTYIGNCNWTILLGGLNIGTSTSNCPGSGRNLVAGIESDSTDHGSVKGYLRNWWEQDGSGNWKQSWDGLWAHYNQPLNIEWLNGNETEEVFNEPF